MALARAGVVVGAAGVVAGSFLPWVVSGQTTRNSFSTVRTARLLELVDNTTVDTMLAAWFLVPLVAAVVLLLALLHRRRSLALVAAGLGLVAGGFAAYVRLSPIETSYGPVVTLAFALVTLLAAVGLVLARPPSPLPVQPGPPGDAAPVR